MTAGWPRAWTPARVIGMSARCPHRRALLTICMGYRHRRALLTPARVISPSRCQQPPHDVNDPLTVPTTRVRINNARSNSHPGRARCGHGRQRASTPKGGTRAKAERAVNTADHAHCPGEHPHQGQTPQEDCSGSRTTPSEYAHKDPDSRNTHRTQRRDQALVCGPVLRNSLPCARHQRTRTPKKDEAKERTHQPTANPNQQTSQPAKKGAVNRMGPARTTWGATPTLPGEPRPHPFAGTPWAPQAAAGGAAPPGVPRPHRRPTAVASPRGAGRRCHP